MPFTFMLKPPKKTKKQKRTTSPIHIAPVTQEKPHPSQRLPTQNDRVLSKNSAPMLFNIPNVRVPRSLKCLLTTVKYVEHDQSSNGFWDIRPSTHFIYFTRRHSPLWLIRDDWSIMYIIIYQVSILSIGQKRDKSLFSFR
ncbi:uncharacterized protein LOC133805086 [Humulus lupulus]|uniref:uncharacterized protein LOC133805086 n=1 Tax=Humulus lupulus TaxID=3486 RepID=UPI002B414D17|nr:uncharacterized protein LOC133805086 [Humulus lupulus]